jgi:hypothetical protein
MRITRLRKHFTAVLGALIVLSLLVIPATANHTWGTYHLSRTSSGQELLVGFNLTTEEWRARAREALTDWNKAGAITLIESTGKTTPKQCKPSAGTIQVCNATYGNTSWLGIAQIWISGGHIYQGTAKQNDTYFNQTRYNTYAWRQMVICQEIAHTFGLGHVNEAYGPPNTGSCMDYTNNPAGGILNGVDYGPPNTKPNPVDHDFPLLKSITHYPEHHSATTTTTSTGLTRAEEEVTSLNPEGWGVVTGTDAKGRPTHYKKQIGPDETVFTFVLPADELADSPVDGGDGTGTGGDGTGDGGRNDGGRNDGGRNDGGRDGGGKRDGAKQDGGRDGGRDDGGKRDGARQRQGHDHDRHNH